MAKPKPENLQDGDENLQKEQNVWQCDVGIHDHQCHSHHCWHRGSSNSNDVRQKQYIKDTNFLPLTAVVVGTGR
jgi:hypothetical protein